jgi:hypothetical protein
MARDRWFVDTVGSGLPCAKPGTSESRKLRKLADEAGRFLTCSRTPIGYVYDACGFVPPRERRSGG